MWRSSFLVKLQAFMLIASNFANKWAPSQVFFKDFTYILRTLFQAPSPALCSPHVLTQVPPSVLNTYGKPWGARFLRATMFFCKRVTSVATFINYSYHYVYCNIFDIADHWHKTITALFSHATIKCCFGRKAYSKYCIIVYLCSCSVLVEECNLYSPWNYQKVYGNLE